MPAKICGDELKEVTERAIALYANPDVGVIGVARAVGRSCAFIKKTLLSAGVALKPRGDLVSIQKIGKPSPRKGAVLSKETRARISAAKIGKKPTLGTRRTPEQRQKMRDARLRFMQQHPERFAALLTKARSAKKRLSQEEKHKRGKARTRYKNLLSRLSRQHGIPKNSASEKALGYSAAEFKSHIERQFLSGMAWDKPASFHIDHITPIADFFERGIFDAAVINALSNLRPIPPEQNRAKGDRRELLI